jgi:hypothetical protein
MSETKGYLMEYVIPYVRPAVLREIAQRKGIKRRIGLSVCAFVLSMYTLAYVLWHLHN